MWTLVFVVLTATIGGHGGVYSVITTLDFKSKAACDAAAKELASSGSVGDQSRYRTITECVQK
jgi:hypothetical protein